MDKNRDIKKIAKEIRERRELMDQLLSPVICGDSEDCVV